MQFNIKIYLLVIVLVIAIFCNTATATATANEHSDHNLNSRQDAIETALKITGFDKLDEFSLEKGNISAELKTLPFVKIPFLWKQFVNKEIWIVKVQNVRLEVTRGKSNVDMDPQLRDFTIYLDSISGKLIRLHSVLDGSTKEYNREPEVEEIEEQMKYKEEFIALPHSNDYKSFIEILASTNTTFFDAHEIIAHCVTRVSIGRKDTLDTWTVDFRGMSIDRRLGPHGPTSDELIYLRGHQRNIINAQTGGLRSAGSLPSTLPPEVIEKYRKRNE